MSPFSIRPAQSADAAQILALCEADVSIPANLDAWLADATGQTVVAEAAGQVIGVTHYALVSPTESWGEGARVAVPWRGKGVGMALIRRCLELARERGAEVARAVTGDDNAGGQHVLEQAGFTQIGAYVLFEAETAGATADPQDERLIRQPGITELDALWAWLEKSNVAPMTGGLVMQGPQGRALTDVVLAEALAAQQVWLLEQWGEIAALMLAGPQRRDLPEENFGIHYLDGTAEGVSRLALHLRVLAGQRGCGLIEARPPDLLILHDALNGASFARVTEHAQWIYAKEL